MSFVMLGNLSVDEIERRSGVVFPDDLKEFMNSRKQESAANVREGCWHCFDVPFNLVCGDVRTATVIHDALKGMSAEFKKPLQISISNKKD